MPYMEHLGKFWGTFLDPSPFEHILKHAIKHVEPNIQQSSGPNISSYFMELESINLIMGEAASEAHGPGIELSLVTRTP